MTFTNTITMARIQSILKHPVKNVGNAGDVVTLKGGYFRYLEKIGKVQHATKENMDHLQANIAQLQAEDEALKEQAEQWASTLRNITLVFSKSGSDQGVLYGSVTSRDIVKMLANQYSIKLSSHQVQLSRPVKECCTLDLVLDLHPHVQTTVKVVVELQNTTGLA